MQPRVSVMYEKSGTRSESFNIPRRNDGTPLTVNVLWFAIPYSYAKRYTNPFQDKHRMKTDCKREQYPKICEITISTKHDYKFTL